MFNGNPAVLKPNKNFRSASQDLRVLTMSKMTLLPLCDGTYFQ